MPGDVATWIDRIDALSVRAEKERDFNVSTETPALFQDARTEATAMVKADRAAFLEGVGSGLRSLAVGASGHRAEVLRSFATIFSTAARGKTPRGLPS